MGRPREHDEATRVALLDAAEALVAAGGPDAVSVRAVADAVGTSTRAVYTLFGSKDGLLAALAQRAYELLTAAITQLPETDDPAHDLVEAALLVFRPMAVGHPSLFRLAFLKAVPTLPVTPETREASTVAFGLLCERFERLRAAGQLGAGRDVRRSAAVFNGLCEGLATTELRVTGLLGDDPEGAWREAFVTLVAGFATPVPRRRRVAARARG